ncbi:MAG: FAD-dependent monooxygenase [Beutenbergiaceae bacterium]
MLSDHPVVIVGAGPIGLVTALGLAHHGIPAIVLEEDDALSLETKAGTVLTRTLEVLDRYGALEPVLAQSLRIDEIGEIDRATNAPKPSVKTDVLADDTRFPFVINIPQGTLENVLHEQVRSRSGVEVRLGSRVRGFSQHDDSVTVEIEGPDSHRYQVQASYLLGCDGGRSDIRTGLGVAVQGTTLEQRYMLVDLRVDLDLSNPRDYPYLAYFADPEEWMILVRQPHCWRFLFPLAPGQAEPGVAELRDKALRFIGEVDEVEVLGTNIYSVHHRVADRWRDQRVFLMGDAAHLITPMWALGLNTGVLDASNLPWRLAWVLRGWADESLLAGYEAEQAAVAIKGSGQMAESARVAMGSGGGQAIATTGWAFAMTRSLLGVSLDVGGTGDWSIVTQGLPDQGVQAGDRVPDMMLFGPDGDTTSVHQLATDSFVALYFTDARRRPVLPAEGTRGLRHILVSRWDAPHDSGLRDRSYFDPGSRLQRKLAVEEDTVVLVRPDSHIAALLPWKAGDGHIADLYASITGRNT